MLILFFHQLGKGARTGFWRFYRPENNAVMGTFGDVDLGGQREGER